MDTQFHTLASELWTEQGSLILQDASGEMMMLSFPIAFLTGGHVATFDYVYEVLGMCFDGAVSLTKLDGTPKGRDEPVVAETLVVTPGATGIQATRGPRFKYKYQSAANDDDDSTMSNSSRSSENQSTFRTALYVRDGACVISDAHWSICISAHILPVSRPEYYTEVLGSRARFSTNASCGLLLAVDLHRAFDKGMVALYPDGDRLIVHVFTPFAPQWRSYHGKVILPSRFRSQFEPAPNVDLLRFHYKQCCMKHIRGYSALMGIPQLP